MHIRSDHEPPVSRGAVLCKPPLGEEVATWARAGQGCTRAE
jgi:hypothetical protein